jgi:GT2 family glycosyltransferase/glycosyltransferase involved in cell wall biosynthesis
MPETIGFVDGLEGAYVRGWALTEGLRPAAIIIRDAAGKPLARGTAEQERPDVGRLAQGRTACGFRIPVRRLRLAGMLRVFADGVELAGSPVPVGPGRYDGDLSVGGSVATGWVNERTEGFRGAHVQLRDQDGALLGEAEAAASREDPDPFHAPARFTLALAPICFGRPDLIVRAFVNGVQFAEAHCAMRVDGYLDALSPSRCGGWLLSPDAPGRTLEIEVFRDGTLVGTGACNLPRQDVRDRYPQAWRVGFEIRLDPAPARAGARHAYSFRLAGTDVELFDSPFMVQDRSEAIEAARRMGRLAQVDDAITPADRTVLRRALAEFIARRRQTDERARVRLPSAAAPGLPDGGRRLAIVIPIYRDVEITRACVESVLAARDPGRDAVVLVNDSSPDEGMAVLLERFTREPDVCLLTNSENRGFIRSINRGLAVCRRGDVLLLNSDTRVFPGLFEELCRVARSAPDIGTVTALSNNATIFSYPHPSLPNAALADVEWAEVAAAAREANGGLAMDVPTGHGFCMLIRREALELAGSFDESFGRGYGEENDFCQRIADLGFRNVAAPGAFVEHRDSISFGAEKKALMEVNLARLRRMYPDYTQAIMEFEHGEGLRRARWPLDAARLRKASAAGTSFALVVTNWLGGGARKAIADIETSVGYGKARKLTLSCRADGMIELEAGSPALRAVFAPDETEALFGVLSAARVTHVLTHQVLGYPPAFLGGLAAWARGRHAIYYVHDFYPICPRVTMIDAAGSFCDIAAPDTCRRCIAGAGAHEASRLNALTPAEHRAAFGELLGAFRHVVAPSEAAASYVRRVWPDLDVAAVPHPEPALVFPASPRDAASQEVVLLGGIGPHKGSAKLLEIARRARLSHPDLRFRVIGHTDIDAELRTLGNVLITGSYEPWEQAGLVAQAEGGVALFLHNWPETYSFTLSEAASHGLFPLVPDLGAPAERVRASGFGAVFKFPIEAGDVLRAIEAAIGRRVNPIGDKGPPAFARPDAVTSHRALMGLEEPSTVALPGRRLARARATAGGVRASA